MLDYSPTSPDQPRSTALLECAVTRWYLLNLHSTNHILDYCRFSCIVKSFPSSFLTPAEDGLLKPAEDALLEVQGLILAVMYEKALSSKSQWEPYLSFLPNDMSHMPIYWTVRTYSMLLSLLLLLHVHIKAGDSKLNH